MNKHITTEMVQTLRHRTGVGMAQCKHALTESHGDMEKAIEYLRKAGMASAVKKGGRETNEGVVAFAENDKAIALVEINAETDFVVQNEKFKEFTRQVSQEILRIKPQTVSEFLKQKYYKDPHMTMDEYRITFVQALGENIQIKRLLFVEKKTDGSYGIYSHMAGKIVALVELLGDKTQVEFAREIAMHAAAEAPEYLSESDVPTEVKKKEEEIAKEQVKGKPAQVIDKIVQGKMKAYYEQACLLAQKYVKDSSTSIAELVESRAKKLGKPLKLTRFVRWQMGE